MAGKDNQNSNNGGGQRQKVTVSGIPPMVQQNFADTHPGFQTNFEGMQQVNGWTPQGNAVVGGGVPMAQPMDFFGQGGGIQGKFDQNPVAAQPAVPSGNGGAQQPYMGNAAENTPQPQSSFEGFQAPQFRPDVQPQQQGSLASLSQALANAGGSAPQFQADPNQRDGGFFGWLGGILPKNRKGIREGETPDEYDARMTRNSKMYFTLADAIRHFGNIVNTSNYAPLQQFNDPNALIEQGYQQRRAERQQRAAQEADAAYKQANMDLKRQQAESDAAYKAMQMQLGLDKFKYQKDRDAVTDNKWKAKFEFDAAKDDRDFKYKQMRDKIKDGQWQAGYGVKLANLNLSRARFAHTLSQSAGSGGAAKGVGYATPYGYLVSKKDLTPQQEKQMWDFMVRNKQITPKKMKEYQLAAKGDGADMGIWGTNNGSPSKAREIIQKAIAYGLMDATKQGDAFRKFCTTQLGMGENRVYNTPQNATTWKRGSVKQGQTGKFSIK